MGIFDVFKKGNSKDGTSKTPSSKLLPEQKQPIDDSFMSNFINNGGKFIYCENNDDVLKAFDDILLENDWYEKDVYCTNPHIAQKFSGFNLEFTENVNSTAFIGDCEYLIANNGSILVCSNQFKEKKLADLPKHFIIFAATSQLVRDISEGLRHIKSKSKTGIPSNITTIKHFRETSKNNDFLSYGSTSKNLYLLLLEDL